MPALTGGLARADRLFRAAGVVTLLLLAATVALLVADSERWTLPFLLAHLAALVALAPLGVALVRRAFAEAAREGDPGIGGVLRRHRGVTGILGVVAVTVIVSLLNFDDGIRWLRRAANLTTVALVIVLVARYLRWRRRPAGVR